jgi:hypothetical protein
VPKKKENKPILQKRGALADRLPKEGPFRYISPAGAGAPPKRVRGNGFMDRKDSQWIWSDGVKPGQCDHWDVTHPDATHSNIRIEGTAHHGSVNEDFF